MRKLEKMNFAEKATYHLLRIIGLLLSIFPFLLQIIFTAIYFLLTFLNDMISKMIITFMYPSKKYYYKHEIGVDIYIDKKGKVMKNGNEKRY